MKLKFLHKRKEEKQTEKEAFSLPKFIIERSRRRLSRSTMI